jgi:K(+)-stimulated pyrophosphate-energized sodium pump
VIGSMLSTYSVRAGDRDTSNKALHAVHRGFLLGGVVSVVGFFGLGFTYLRFNAAYFVQYATTLGGFGRNGDGMASVAELPLWAPSASPILICGRR